MKILGLRWPRLTMARAMLLVIPAAAASALFAKVYQYVPAATYPFLKVDAPILFVAAVVLTAVALGALKGHTAGQMMLQVTLACLGYVALLGLVEAKLQRPLLYWFQVSFGLLVTLPLIARGVVKREMERGPRRTWWKNTWEAVLFSFFTMVLALLGAFLQWVTAIIIGQVIGIPL